MAAKKFIVHIDLNKNQLLNAVVQNLATDPTSPLQGQIYFNTANKILWGYNGTVWVDMMASGGATYTHPEATNGAQTPTLTGANVLATFQTDAEGHVDVLTTRVLTLADLGYTGAADANNYVHPTFAGNDLGVALSGAQVISDVEVNAEGHVTGFATRSLTAADIGAAVINDAVTNSTDTWSSTKIEAEIAAALSGVPTPTIESYNASTNVPDLETGAGAVKKGDFYVVSAAGTFFTEDVSIGDTLIAKIDAPTVLADWIRIERNIPDIVDATEVEKGIIRLATAAEVDALTLTNVAVSPAHLGTVLGGYVKTYSQNIGDAAATAITVTHNLGTTDVLVNMKEGTEAIDGAWTAPTINTVQFQFNTAPTLNQYHVTIVG